MKPRDLLLLLGSFALWAELSAAPRKGSAGPSPLSQLGDSGAPQPVEIPLRDECSALPSEVTKDACVLQEDPVPGSKEAETPPSREGQATPDALLPSGGAKPVPTEKPACKTRPGKPTEKLQAGPVRNLLLEKRPGLGEGNHPGGKEVLPAVGGPSPTAEKPSPDTGHVAQEECRPDQKPISGGESGTGGKAAPEAEPPTSCKDPAAPTETPRPCAGKLTSGEKPTPCDKPTSGGTASSDPGHATPGKPGPAEKPAPHERPGSGGKPAAGKEPEKEADGGDGEEEEEDTEDEEEDDEEEEEEEEEDGQEDGDAIFREDNAKGQEDAFDHELDYGLNQSPFNSDEYHDWWGGGEAEELEAKPEGDVGGLSEGGGAGEGPAFDVWGDLVEKGSGPEAWTD